MKRTYRAVTALTSMLAAAVIAAPSSAAVTADEDFEPINSPIPSSSDGSFSLDPSAAEVTESAPKIQDSGHASLNTGIGISGCYGKANNPHVSTTSATRGLIKGYAQTICPVSVPRVHVRTHVKQLLWHGWVRSGSVVSGTAYGAKTIGRSGVATHCTNDDWKTVATSEVTESNGRVYSGTGSKQAYVGNC